VVSGQVVGIIEPNIHPSGPIRAAGPHEYAVLSFLAVEKTDLVRLIYRHQDRVFQRGFRARGSCCRESDSADTGPGPRSAPRAGPPVQLAYSSSRLHVCQGTPTVSGYRAVADTSQIAFSGQLRGHRGGEIDLSFVRVAHDPTVVRGFRSPAVLFPG
jgi:hypothetical protein